jgi:cytochrome c oxidase cbb3-type subunit 3
MPDYKDEVLHAVDEIEEYDNPLPGWWLMTWYAAIVFSIIYMAYYSLNFGPSHQDAYQAEKIGEFAQIQDFYDKNPIEPPSTELLLAGAINPEILSLGRQRFIKTCAACHGDNGQGLIGPNLADDFWIHGGKVTDVFTTIVKGVPAKGMPTWGRSIPQDEIAALVSYIRSINGSNPPDAKKQEGDRFDAQALPNVAQQPGTPVQQTEAEQGEVPIPGAN